MQPSIINTESAVMSGSVVKNGHAGIDILQTRMTRRPEKSESRCKPGMIHHFAICIA